jgi:hypothetical protein
MNVLCRHDTSITQAISVVRFNGCRQEVRFVGRRYAELAYVIPAKLLTQWGASG